jgi:hypothetical protein
LDYWIQNTTYNQPAPKAAHIYRGDSSYDSEVYKTRSGDTRSFPHHYKTIENMFIAKGFAFALMSSFDIYRADYGSTPSRQWRTNHRYLLSNYIHRPYLEKFAGQAHETAGASSTSEAAALALHVHLQSHFRSGVDGGLLVTGLHSERKVSEIASIKVREEKKD